MEIGEFIDRLREMEKDGIRFIEIRTFRNSVSIEDLSILKLDESKIKGDVVCFEHSLIKEGVSFIPELIKEINEKDSRKTSFRTSEEMMAEAEAEFAKKILQAIKDVKKNDNPETLLITYNRKQSQVINMENDLGDLENAKFGLLHPTVIILETNFKLHTKTIKKIEIVSVKKKIFSRNQ